MVVPRGLWMSAHAPCSVGNALLLTQQLKPPPRSKGRLSSFDIWSQGKATRPDVTSMLKPCTRMGEQGNCRRLQSCDDLWIIQTLTQHIVSSSINLQFLYLSLKLASWSVDGSLVGPKLWRQLVVSFVVTKAIFPWKVASVGACQSPVARMNVVKYHSDSISNESSMQGKENMSSFTQGLLAVMQNFTFLLARKTGLSQGLWGGTSFSWASSVVTLCGTHCGVLPTVERLLVLSMSSAT